MWPDWLRPHCIMDVFPSALKATLFNWTARDGFESGLKQCLNTARGWRSQATGLKEHQTLILIIKTNNLRLWAVEGRQAATEHTLCWIQNACFYLLLWFSRIPWLNFHWWHSLESTCLGNKNRLFLCPWICPWNPVSPAHYLTPPPGLHAATRWLRCYS